MSSGLKVVIVAESSLQSALARALPAPEFDVVAATPRTADLLDAVRRHEPQVVLLQVGVAAREGTHAVEEVMGYVPRPILLVTAPGERTDDAFAALSAGALDVVAWQPGQAQELAHRVKLLAGMRVITHVRGRHRRSRGSEGQSRGGRLVAIGASLGGPRALATLLQELRPPLPAPVLIAQHISPGFSEGLAHWLSVEAHCPVREATDGMPLVPGLIAIAPTGRQLVVEEGVARLTDDPPVGGFKPSCSVLFRTAGQAYGPRAIGVVLTGMGTDGAEGLLSMRKAGARTFAQDESTSVVFGMPRAAHEAGAVEQLLPLEGLAAAVRRVLEGV